MGRESEFNRPINIFETQTFQKRSALEKQTAREAIDWGFIVQNQFTNLEQWSKYFYLWTISVHEVGHATLVKDTDHHLTKVTNVPEGYSLGSTHYRLNTSFPAERINDDLSAIGLAGGIAAEVVGLHPFGTGSDHGMVDSVAERQKRTTGASVGSTKSKGRERAWDRLASDITGLKYGAHKLNRDRTTA